MKSTIVFYYPSPESLVEFKNNNSSWINNSDREIVYIHDDVNPPRIELLPE